MRSSPNPVAAHPSDPGCKLQIPQPYSKYAASASQTFVQWWERPYSKTWTYSTICHFFHPTWSCCDLQPQWSSFQSLSLSACLSVCVSCTWNSALNGFKNKGRSHGLRQWFSTWLINPWFRNPSDSQSGIFRQPGLSSGGVSCLTAGFWTGCDLGD